MMNDEAKESAVEAAPSVTGINIPTGLSSADPAFQSKMSEIMKIRGMDVARGGLMGAAAGAGAAQGAMNPLTAFIQGAAAGLQIPSQIFQAKQAQVKSVVDATPFGVTHPEIANQPGYQMLAGMPTGIALEAIKQISIDAAKILAEGSARKAESDIMTDQEASNYSRILNSVGIALSPDHIKGLRKDDVKEFMQMKGVKAGDGEFEKILPLKEKFEGTAVVKDYFNIKNSAGTINRLAAQVENGQTLSNQDQILLAREFLNAQSSTGGGRASGEMFALIENQGWAGQLRDALSGKPVNIDPEQAKAINNAVNTKMAEIKANASAEADKWKPLIRSKSETEKKLILGEFLEDVKEDPIKKQASSLDYLPEGSVLNGMVKTAKGWQIMGAK